MQNQLQITVSAPLRPRMARLVEDEDRTTEQGMKY